MTCATARSMSSGSPRAACHGMSRDGVPLLRGRLLGELGDVVGPERVAVAERPAGSRRRARARGPRRAARSPLPRRRCAGGGLAARAGRRYGSSPPARSAAPSPRAGTASASTRVDGPRRTWTTHGPPAAHPPPPTTACPARRAQPGSSRAVAPATASRSPGAAGRAAPRARPRAGPPARRRARGPRHQGAARPGHAGRRSPQQALLAHCGGQRRVAVAVARQPALDAFEVHRRSQGRVVVVHGQQRLAPPLAPAPSSSVGSAVKLQW